MTTAVNFHRTRRLSIKNYRDEGLEPENSASSSECIIIIGECLWIGRIIGTPGSTRSSTESICG